MFTLISAAIDDGNEFYFKNHLTKDKLVKELSKIICDDIKHKKNIENIMDYPYYHTIVLKDGIKVYDTEVGHGKDRGLCWDGLERFYNTDEYQKDNTSVYLYQEKFEYEEKEANEEMREIITEAMQKAEIIKENKLLQEIMKKEKERVEEFERNKSFRKLQYEALKKEFEGK